MNNALENDEKRTAALKEIAKAAAKLNTGIDPMEASWKASAAFLNNFK